MTDIYLEDLVYDKPEIDTKLTDIDNDITSGLALKINNSDRGSPGGVATLDGVGKVPYTGLPLATLDEALDTTNAVTVMSPLRVNEVIITKDYITNSDADATYGDLKSNGTVMMHANYNPQNDKDIATVEYVQTASSGASHSYVVDTQAEMIVLTGINTGDTCFVTGEVDPMDNGEFIAKMDNPAAIDDWVERENKTAWGGIIGTLSDQTDLQAVLNTHTTDISTNTAAIALNTAKETNTITNLGVTYSATEVGITSSDGTNIIIDPADATDAGVMTSADKVKLDGLGGAIIATIYSDSTGDEPIPTPGQVFYSDNTLNLNTEYGTTLNIGKELTDEVYNNTGATITNGSPVVVTGLFNGMPTIGLAQANTFLGCDDVIVATMDIPTGTIGAATTYGKVNDLDLSSFALGDKLYVSEATPGIYTTTPPSIATYVGTVLSNDALTGSIYVKPQSHIVLPEVTAYMNDGNLDTNTITTAYQRVSAYTTFGNVVMEFDPSLNNGTITVPATGVYSLVVNLSFTFDAVGNGEESFNLRLVGSVSGNNDIPITVPRNGGAASAFPKISFDATAGEVFYLEVGGATDDLTTLVEQLMSFEITSKHIR